MTRNRMSKTTRPPPLQITAKEVSVELDPIDVIAWNIDASSPDDGPMDLLNIVELDQEEIASFVRSSSLSEEGNTSSRKRSMDSGPEEGKEEHPRSQQGEIRPAVTLQEEEEEEETMLRIDDRPRVSRRKKKAKSLPKRPLNAYGIYYHQERQRIVESMSEGSLSEDDIQRQVGKLWRALPEEDIKKYEALAEQDKARYHEEMEAHGLSSSSESASSREPPKNEFRDEEERGYFAYDFPPPPPGVMVIPATISGSDAGSVAAAAGMKESTPSTSPVPPPTPPARWSYAPQMARGRASYPSPVPSAAPRMVPSSPYGRSDYYRPPSRGQWVTPPYQPHRVYSPHFGRPARPVPVYSGPKPPPQQFSIPPGMELALPNERGVEKKYRVTYRCYTMPAENVQGFLDSMNASQRHPYHPPPSPSPPSPKRPQPPYGRPW